MAMSQKSRMLGTLAAALVLAGGLSAWAYYGVFEQEKAQEEKKAADEKLFDLDKAKVQKLSVAAKGGTTVLERAGEGWKITAPVQASADKAVVDGLLDRMAGAKLKRVVAEQPADEKPYGLAAPTATIAATVEGGAVETLVLGAPNDFDGTIFARTGASPRVVTVEGAARTALEKTTFDLREKRLATFEDKEVRSVRVEGSGFSYALERDDAGAWRVTAPLQDRADDATANRVLSVVKNLRATAIAAETAADPKAFGLDAPKVTATVALKSGAALALAVGEATVNGAAKTFARVGDGFVAEVAGSVARDLDKPVMELRDKTVLPFDREKVAQLKFAGAGEGEVLVVERRREKKDEKSTTTEEKWQLLSPRVAPAKRWKLSSALYGVSSLKAAEFVEEDAKDLARYGLDAPVRTITVFAEGGAELGRLLVGKADGDKVFVKSAASARVSKVDKKKIDDLPATVADVEETSTPAGGPDGHSPPN